MTANSEPLCKSNKSIFRIGRSARTRFKIALFILFQIYCCDTTLAWNIDCDSSKEAKDDSISLSEVAFYGNRINVKNVTLFAKNTLEVIKNATDSKDVMILTVETLYISEAIKGPYHSDEYIDVYRRYNCGICTDEKVSAAIYADRYKNLFVGELPKASSDEKKLEKVVGERPSAIISYCGAMTR